MKQRILIAAIAAATITHALDASAQWLEDRRLREGEGIRAGDVEIHPGIAAEVGYDSNWFQRSGDVGPVTSDIGDRETFFVNEKRATAARLRITPHVAVSTLGPERRAEGGGGVQKVAFRAEASARYNELFAIEEANEGEVPDQRHVSGNVGAQLDIFPKGQVGGDIFSDYTRTVAPSNSPDTSQAWDRHMVRAGAGISLRPGGGLFAWRFGYDLRATFFEDEPFQNLNNLQHTVESRNRWEFLPRTALISRVQLGFIRYNGDDPSENDGDFVRTSIGVNGLITRHLGVLVMGGWGATFYEPTEQTQQNFDSFIGQGELTWYLMPQQRLPDGGAAVGLSSVSLGYTRNFSNSYFGDYFSRDRVYAGASYFGMGRFVLQLTGGYSRIGRPRIDSVQPPLESYGENRVDVTLFGEYRPLATVGIFTTLSYNANLTDAVIPAGAASPGSLPPGDNLAFNRFETWLGVRWFL